MSSTFSGFAIGELGLRASQLGLNVTGQNISNINTTGYTRQVLDQVSLNFSNSGRYATSANVGNGVLVKDISQVRDQYLDIRYRNEAADVGESDETLSTLDELEDVLDEANKDGIMSQLSDLSSKLQKFSSGTNNEEYESSVKSSAESLTKLFNQYAKEIETIRSNKESNLTDVDVPQVNKILQNISELNQTIKTSEINGNNALELMDQRNTLIDSLASYVKIDVTYVPEKLSDSLTINNLKIDLVGNKNTINLIDGTNYSSFKTSTGTDGSTQLNVVDSSGNAVKDSSGNVIGSNIYDELSTGSLKSSLEMLNCSGDFDSTENSPRGIGYYEKMLDLMASKFAKTFNDLNNSNLPSDTSADDLHNMFASTDGGDITAKNITIASGWSNDKYGVTTTTSTDTKTTGANDVVLKMVDALKSDQTFINPGSDPDSTSDDKTVFTGSFSGFYSKLNTTLGIDVKSTTQTLDNHQSVADEISDSKDGVSGVSLDDEGVNLIKYQHSYTAASRFMTTLNEIMGTLINSMGVV